MRRDLDHLFACIRMGISKMRKYHFVDGLAGRWIYYFAVSARITGKFGQAPAIRAGPDDTGCLVGKLAASVAGHSYYCDT